MRNVVNMTLIKPEVIITSGFSYSSYNIEFKERNNKVHIIKIEQNKNDNLTLLISKTSEAINPLTDNNHIGDGASINDILKKQDGIRFIINAGFNHYRKNFYYWPNNKFNIGDPVGLVKIRKHLFEDRLNKENYGYFSQFSKSSEWKISDDDSYLTNYKYVLGCTPKLIIDYKPISIPNEIPVNQNEINPPSYLGHANQIHPRTAVGIKNNTIYFVVVENNISGNGGCTLEELQSIGLELKLNSFLNLDGGGSSQFKIFKDNKEISNFIHSYDTNRVLGHTFILFDETLKKNLQ